MHCKLSRFQSDVTQDWQLSASTESSLLLAWTVQLLLPALIHRSCFHFLRSPCCLPASVVQSVNQALVIQYLVLVLTTRQIPFRHPSGSRFSGSLTHCLDAVATFLRTSVADEGVPKKCTYVRSREPSCQQLLALIPDKTVLAPR